MATPRDDVFTPEVMNTDKFAVVFDTNSYRNLIRDTVSEDFKFGFAVLVRPYVFKVPGDCIVRTEQAAFGCFGLL